MSSLLDSCLVSCRQTGSHHTKGISGLPGWSGSLYTYVANDLLYSKDCAVVQRSFLVKLRNSEEPMLKNYIKNIQDQLLTYLSLP